METGTHGPADGETVIIDYGPEIMVEYIETKKCALCGGTDRHPIDPFTTYSGNTHHYWLCKCGMVYLDRYAEDQKLYYTQVRRSTPKAKRNWQVIERIQRIPSMIPDEWEIESHLDVGCGTEMLMERIGEKYGCKSEGVEYTQEFIKSDHKIHGSLSEVTKKYDLVTGLHVLEHVPDPLDFMRRMAAVANKYVIVEVPSFGGNALHSKHISMFTPWTLAKVAAEAHLSPFPITGIFVTDDKGATHSVLLGMGEVDGSHN